MRQSGIVAATTVSLLVSFACHEKSRTVPTAPSVVVGPGLVQTKIVQAFAAAGSIGGGVLVPGTRFPPTGGSSATLLRGESCLEYTIDTTGLPPGAYTNWVFTFDNPEACRNPVAGSVCFGGPDIFGTPATHASAFYGTGGVVGDDGVGRFVSRKCIGESLGIPETQHVAGEGFVDPMNAAVYVLVRYHGPASENPDQLHWQTNAILGGCRNGANSRDLGPAGIHCPDLQIAVFNPPGG